MTEDLFTACAKQVAVNPELVEQLLKDHTPTAHGWCRAHDAHAERHPCSIRRLAELACTHLRGDSRPRWRTGVTVQTSDAARDQL